MRQINLFNPALLPKKQQFSSRMMLQTALILSLACSALVGWNVWRTSQLQQQQQSAASQLQTVQARLQKVQSEVPIREKNPQLETDLQYLEGQLRNMQQMQGWLQNGQRGNTDGFARYMTALARQHQDGLWLTGFEIEGAATRLDLQGRAMQPELIGQWLARLASEPVFKGRILHQVQIQRPMLEDRDDNPQTAPASAPPAAPALNLPQNLTLDSQLTPANASRLLSGLLGTANGSPAATPAATPTPVPAVRRPSGPRPAPWLDFRLQGGDQ